MKILTIDTCSCSCSVSLHDDKKLIGEIYLNNGFTHSQTLAPIVEDILKYGDIKVKDIDLFGVTNGPGSFTGLRIGLSTVKGMTIVNDAPCIGVSSLYAIALNARFIDGYICVCMDARNNQVYNAIFNCHGGKIERIADDRAIDINELMDEIKRYEKKIIFVGDGAEICYNTLGEHLNDEKLLLLPKEYSYPRACRIGEEVFNIYNLGQISYGEDLLPRYLKLAQAERELKNRHLNSKIN